MIGKPQWFKYRIFGWGVAPKTWQGWVYLAAFIALFAITTILPFVESTKMLIMGGIMLVLFVDVIIIMTKLPKVSDERENYHQLIIERNCSFAAIAALVTIMLYQTYKNVGFPMTQKGIPFDVSILVVLGAMLFAKIISTLYVKMKL